MFGKRFSVSKPESGISEDDEDERFFSEDDESDSRLALFPESLQATRASELPRIIKNLFHFFIEASFFL